MTIQLINIKDRFDMDGFCGIFSDYDSCYYTSSFVHPYTREQGEARLPVMLERQERHAYACENLVWQDVEIVGSVGIFVNGDGALEIGYAIHPKARGKGVASQAVRAMLAQTQAQGYKGKVQAGYAKDNPASGRVLEKAGFEQIGEGGFFSKGADKYLDCWRMETSVEGL